MSPFEIMVLLHHHTSPSEYPNRNNPAYEATIEYFIDAEILEPGSEEMASRIYTTTHKGAALVSILCSTPLPVQQFMTHAFKLRR